LRPERRKAQTTLLVCTKTGYIDPRKTSLELGIGRVAGKSLTRQNRQSISASLLIAAMHEKGSLTVPSNLSFGQKDATFAHDATLTAMLLDRLLRHALIVRIASENCRLKHQRHVGKVKAISAENADKTSYKKERKSRFF
jgi:hypothetical protein